MFGTSFRIRSTVVTKILLLFAKIIRHNRKSLQKSGDCD